jgi:arylsulfatase A-like enzyme
MRPLTRKLALAVALTLSCALPTLAERVAARPNFVVFLVDDLGYGDLTCFGRANVSTPHIDGLARDGVRLTQWLSAAPICTPSRAALQTGRLPVRYGLAANKLPFRVFPTTASTGGIPPEEATLGEALGMLGYATSLSGKWHLGISSRERQFAFLPPNKGFESWLGVPYTNMHACREAPSGSEGALFCLLMANLTIVQQPLRLATLTRELTRHATGAIERAVAAGRPFLALLSFLHVHTPLFTAPENKGRSRGGAFGDNVEEMDDAVGEVLAALARLGVERDTLVLLTSDNGPFAEEGYAQSGRTGGLKGSKGQTWEGGIRVPALARWPGRVPRGAVTDTLVGTMDIFPTLLALAGGAPAANLDGRDILPVLTRPHQAASPHRHMWHYCGKNLAAVRQVQPDGSVLKFHLLVPLWKNKGKSELCTQCCPYGAFAAGGKGGSLCDCALHTDLQVREQDPLVFDVSRDMREDVPLTSETFPAGPAAWARALADMRAAVAEHRRTLERKPKDQLHGIDLRNFPCCDGRFPLASCTCDKLAPPQTTMGTSTASRGAVEALM